MLAYTSENGANIKKFKSNRSRSIKTTEILRKALGKTRFKQMRNKNIREKAAGPLIENYIEKN